MKYISRCPVCHATIPVWMHLSFNNNIGLNCPSCHSVLEHKKNSFLTKGILLFVFAISISRLIDGNTKLIWVVLTICSLCLAIYAQLSLRFIIRYKHKNGGTRKTTEIESGE